MGSFYFLQSLSFPVYGDSAHQRELYGWRGAAENWQDQPGKSGYKLAVDLGPISQRIFKLVLKVMWMFCVLSFDSDDPFISMGVVQERRNSSALAMELLHC